MADGDRKQGRGLDDNLRRLFDRFSDQRSLWEQVSNPERLVDVMDTVSENSEAIEAAVDALVAAHESGLLDVLTAVSRDEMAAHDPEGDTEPVRQLYTILRALDGVDAAAVAEMADYMPSGEFPLEDWTDPGRVGILGSLRRFRDPEVQRGLGRMFLLLGMLGSETRGRG